MIYLDNAATTKPAECAIHAAELCLKQDFGNPSSLHRFGLNAQLHIDLARKQIAESLGTEPERIIFTSGATESNNFALRGITSVYGKRNKKKIITSAVEHASVRNTLDELEKQGYEIIRVQPDAQGRFHAEDFLSQLDEQVFFISMMLVENETGRILPVQEVFQKVRKRYPEIILHCDAVQAYMKIPFKLKTLSADLLSISAHKIHGIKGTGALFVRKSVRLKPLLTGGKQENALRPGTEAVPLISAFGEAVSMMKKNISERLTNTQKKKAFLWEKLSALPDIYFNSERENAFSSPYIVNFSVKGIRSEIMLHYLEQKEIYVSSGSACSKGAKSDVLSAYSILENLADSAIRVSFSEETTEEELFQLVQAIEEAQKNLIHQ